MTNITFMDLTPPGNVSESLRWLIQGEVENVTSASFPSPPIALLLFFPLHINLVPCENTQLFQVYCEVVKETTQHIYISS